MRNSKQRDVVLNVVCESCDHPTAEVIHFRAREIIPNISLGTVYRDLKQLVEAGMVRQIAIPEGADRFDKTVKVHAHFHCKSCGAVTDMPDEVAEYVRSRADEQSDYEITGVELLFYGKCDKCCGTKKS